MQLLTLPLKGSKDIPYCTNKKELLQKNDFYEVGKVLLCFLCMYKQIKTY